MPARTGTGLRDAVSRNLSLIFPILIVGAVLVLVAPLPPMLMDLLLSANITLSVVILLTAIHVRTPLEFSVFPAILLGTTLLRLVLNVASTRLILSQGAQHGTQAAGRVIEAFGDFVAAGSPTVGLIMFVILVAIQFLVITKGATRIGEVAARFALDGMPGRQMAVDADLAAGLTTKEDARLRREQIAQQADFYGAMDGASKFVRGDAVAGLLITAVNILGGLYIGVINEGMTLPQAASVFTTLTIGDGLVAQIPAFLISIAAGLIVTRTSADSDLSRDAVSQVFRHPTALFIAAGFLIAAAFTGLPAAPLLALGIGCACIGFLLQTGAADEAEEANNGQPVNRTGLDVRPASPTAVDPTAINPAVPQPKDELRVESLELELGVGLIRLADAAAGGDLLERITHVRHRVAQELGFILPKVRICDNLTLDPRRFQIKLRGVPVAWETAYADALLAVDAGAVEGPITGIETTDPATGRRALWIEPAQQEAAKALGYAVHSSQTFIVQVLAEVVRSHSEELLTRQHVHALLADLRQRSPQLVDELIPHPLKTAHVHQVLSNLLRERVPIRDLETIVGTLADHADRTRNVVLLTEAVRTALARTICQSCRDERRRLHAIALDPALEDELGEAIDVDDAGIRVRLSNAASTALIAAMRDPLERIAAAGQSPTVVCRAEVRAGLRSLTSRALPRASILGLHEITQDTELLVHAEVSAAALLDPGAAAAPGRADGPNPRASAAGRMSIPIHEPVLT